MTATKEQTQPVQEIGRYALFDAIASGGMATVHLGRLQGDAGFARTVAIKRLRATKAHDQKLVTMFVDEARLAARIQHPNVVGTIDVVARGKEIFLVLEYVHGESLRGLINAWGADKPLDPRVACTIAAGALHGLHAAHEAKSEEGAPLGIVHRDVSPQNVLIGRDGIVRVVDFGVAKAAGRIQVTQTGQLKGKPRYMAPEQLIGDRSATVDRRTDVFGLAIVLWEMLCGQRLFHDESDLEVLHKVVKMPIPSPHEVNPQVSLELSAVVMKGLDRAQDRRFATARAFARAIETVNPRGLMSQDALGDWVVSLVGDLLAEREARVRAIESASRRQATAPSPILIVPKEDDELSTERALAPADAHPASEDDLDSTVRIAKGRRGGAPTPEPAPELAEDLKTTGKMPAYDFNDDDRTIPLKAADIKPAAPRPPAPTAEKPAPTGEKPGFDDDRTLPLSAADMQRFAERHRQAIEAARASAASQPQPPTRSSSPKSPWMYVILAALLIGALVAVLTRC